MTGKCSRILDVGDQSYDINPATGCHYYRRPTVTFPATEHHRPLTSTNLYCLVTEAHWLYQCLRTVVQIPSYQTIGTQQSVVSCQQQSDHYSVVTAVGLR